MAERGREYEVVAGARLDPGEVDRITPADPSLKIPHMGWNTLNERRSHPLLDGIALGTAGPARLFRALVPPAASPSAPISSPRRTMAVRLPPWSAATTCVGTQFHPGEEPAAGPQADRAIS